MTMKMACCLAAISIAVRVSAQNPDVPAKGAAAQALGVESPDTWEAASTEAKKRLHAVTQDLIKIALDEAQPVEVRRKAIFQLGKINDESALEFLIKNISLFLPMDTIDGDDDSLKETPCQYALYFSGNWRVGQLVLKSLDTPKSAMERMRFSSVLESCLGPNVARVAVEEQLFRSGRPISAERKENLEAIRAHLVQLITRTQTVRQAELEVSVPEKARQNEPTDLIIRLRNLGQRPVKFGHINGYRDCKIQIFDAAQRPCPYTAFGHQMMGGEDGEFQKFVVTPVDPGKSHEWRIDIAKCFQLKPGRYSIAVSLELNPATTDAFKIVVDDVVFDVI